MLIMFRKKPLINKPMQFFRIISLSILFNCAFEMSTVYNLQFRCTYIKFLTICARSIKHIGTGAQIFKFLCISSLISFKFLLTEFYPKFIPSVFILSLISGSGSPCFFPLQLPSSTISVLSMFFLDPDTSSNLTNFFISSLH